MPMRQEGDAAPPNDQVKNYIGKPIPEKLYSQLVATHQRLQKKVGGETLMLTDVWGGHSRAAEATSTAANRSGKLLPHEACMAREQWN